MPNTSKAIYENTIFKTKSGAIEALGYDNGNVSLRFNFPSVTHVIVLDKFELEQLAESLIDLSLSMERLTDPAEYAEVGNIANLPMISLYEYNTVEGERDNYRGGLEEVQNALTNAWKYPDEASLINRIHDVVREYLPPEEPTTSDTDIPF